MSKSASTCALALLLICASPRATLGQLQDGLSSPSQEVRDATAEIVRLKFVPTARSRWDPTLDAVRQLVSKDSVVALLQGLGAAQEGGMSSGQTSYESFRLDSEWVMRCSFQRTNGGEKLYEAELHEFMQPVWVAPPDGFTGPWRTYFVNGQLSHEIEYSRGAYSGVFTTFHSDGSKAVVQHYRNGDGSR